MGRKMSLKARSKVAASTARTKRVGLSTLEEHRLRRALRRAACSEPWVDAQIKSVLDHTGDGQAIVCRFHEARVFPPGGRQETAMKWCRLCGRYTPPNCIDLLEHRSKRAGEVHSATLQCDDCRLGIDAEVFRELHEAGLFLRPSGSMSFFKMGERLSDRRRG
jgi:hypothetical protein